MDTKDKYTQHTDEQHEEKVVKKPLDITHLKQWTMRKARALSIGDTYSNRFLDKLPLGVVEDKTADNNWDLDYFWEGCDSETYCCKGHISFHQYFDRVIKGDQLQIYPVFLSDSKKRQKLKKAVFIIGPITMKRVNTMKWDKGDKCQKVVAVLDDKETFVHLADTKGNILESISAELLWKLVMERSTSRPFELFYCIETHANVVFSAEEDRLNQ